MFDARIDVKLCAQVHVHSELDASAWTCTSTCYTARLSYSNALEKYQVHHLSSKCICVWCSKKETFHQKEECPIASKNFDKLTKWKKSQVKNYYVNRKNVCVLTNTEHGMSIKMLQRYQHKRALSTIFLWNSVSFLDVFCRYKRS